jgi:hypothetical protein
LDNGLVVVGVCGGQRGFQLGHASDVCLEFDGECGADIYTPSRHMLYRHQAGLKTLFNYFRLREATLGHLTNIECDFSTIDGQLTAHWHSHSLLVVDKKALSDHRYVRQAEYVALWRRALRVDYNPIVDVRVVRNRDGDSTLPTAQTRGVRECLKYALDPTGFFDHTSGQPRVEPRAALAFLFAVYRRRLLSFGGLVAEARKHERRQRRAEALARKTAAEFGACSEPTSGVPG